MQNFILFATLSLFLLWASRTDAPAAESRLNTTEQNILGLKALTFDSFIFLQLQNIKAEANDIHLYIDKNVNDAKFIDLYNDIGIKINHFIDHFVMKICENNKFEEIESLSFYKKMSEDWIQLQREIIELSEIYKTEIEKEKNKYQEEMNSKIEAVKKSAHQFIESGFEAVRDVVAFTLNSLQSYVTEYKTPVNQQSVIDFLNKQKWEILGKVGKKHKDPA